MLSKPRFNETQIETLKTDTKSLSRAIIQSLEASGAKYPPQATLNAISFELGYKDFSELCFLSVPVRHYEDLSLLSILSNEQILSAYKKLNHKGKAEKKLDINVINHARRSLEMKQQDTNEPSILLEDLYEAINNDVMSEYNHQYKEGEGFPRQFKMSKEHRFFSELEDWDHFRVYDGSDYKCYTVEEFEHIYTKETCFNVVLGRRYDNGLSLGDK